MIEALEILLMFVGAAFFAYCIGLVIDFLWCFFTKFGGDE